MTAASTVRASIGRTLLVQLCIIEIISMIFFTRIGAWFPAGVAAPLWGVVVPVMALLDWSRSRVASGWFVMGCIALVLLGAGFVAWFRFAGRFFAHAAFALYSFWSMLLLLALK